MNTRHLTLKSRGYELDMRPESFGELRRSDFFELDANAMRSRFAEDGYLYLPGYLDREEVLDSRREFLRRLDERDQLETGYPPEDAVVRQDRKPLGVRLDTDNAPLRKVLFSGRIVEFFETFFDGPIRYFDHIWTRCIGPGKGTKPHADLVYMGRGTHSLMTSWIPHGDVSFELGGLMMLEKSHLQSERLRNYLETDVDTYCVNRGPYKHKSGALSSNPVSLREKLGGRWLTSEFRAGDLLVFGMKTVHASLDNQTRSFRISTDTRYQLASEAIDQRWVGPNTVEYAEKNRIGKIC